jgi:6,7-dimethyl-8-ribityllumazine synthase
MASNIDNKLLLQTDNLQIQQSQVVVVYTEWNEEIINELVAGANNIFMNYTQVTVHTFQVPGCFEIPHAIKQIHETMHADAYVAFGCVIRGETPHFDFVSKAATDGILQLNLTQNAPVIFGVLTVNTLEQAQERIGGKHGHKGEEAAIAALKMIDLKSKLDKKRIED